MIYKFAPYSKATMDDVKGTEAYRLHEKCERGETLTRSEKDRIFSAISGSSYGGKTGWPVQGWMFTFSEVLFCYFVQFRYGHIEQHYAPDKTAIRKAFVQVKKIVEV